MREIALLVTRFAKSARSTCGNYTTTYVTGVSLIFDELNVRFMAHPLAV